MHTHFCEVCKQVVAVCSDNCTQDHPHYCSAHYPDPDYRIVDKPTVRMTVRVANGEEETST